MRSDIMSILRSVYFKTALNTAVGENRKVVDVQECSAHVLGTVIDFMYGIDMPEDITYDDAKSLLGMADLYLMEDLKDVMAPHLAKQLREANVLEKSQLAEKYGAKRLKEICCDFVLANLDNINKAMLDELSQTLAPLLGKRALESLKESGVAKPWLRNNIEVANDLLGFNISTFEPYKTRKDFQSMDEYKRYMTTHLKPKMLVRSNNLQATWTHVNHGGEFEVAEKTFGRVVACPSEGPVVKWPLQRENKSTAMRGSYIDLDILTPPTDSQIFKL